MAVVDNIASCGFSDDITLGDYGSNAVANAQVLATGQVHILVADDIHIVVQGALVREQVHIAVTDENAFGIVEVLSVGVEASDDGVDFIVHSRLICAQIIISTLTIQ